MKSYWKKKPSLKNNHLKIFCAERIKVHSSSKLDAMLSLCNDCLMDSMEASRYRQLVRDSDSQISHYGILTPTPSLPG